MSDTPMQTAVEGTGGLSWFCVQTHPKHEHIAAQSLAKVRGFETYNPQMRTRRATRRGPVWFVESVFPGYVFARFDLHLHLAAVCSTACVSRVVHFNSLYPTLSDEQMNELQATFGLTEAVDLSGGVAVGDSIRIVGGAFHDLVAVVQRVWPARQRVQALLEFLGQMTTAEVDLHRVTVEERAPVPTG